MEKVVEELLFDKYDLEEDNNNICLKLTEASVEQICDFLVCNKEKIRSIAAANIPQFSNLALIPSVLNIITNAGNDNIDFEYIGDKLKVSHSQSAKVKYGENHLKLVIQMGLVLKNPYRVSNLGKIYLLMKDTEQDEMNRKLFMKIPIVQKIIIEATEENTNAMDILKSYLAPKTAIRRKGNVRNLVLNVVKDLPENKRNDILNNITWNDK